MVYVLHHETPIVLKLQIDAVSIPSTFSREVLSHLSKVELEPGIAEFVKRVESAYVYLYRFEDYKSCSQADILDFCVLPTYSYTAERCARVHCKVGTKVWVIILLFGPMEGNEG